MSNRVVTENWIPLMDYAMKKGISLSTLRRHIKANKVVYRVEGGRYLLCDEARGFSADADIGSRGGDSAVISHLNSQLQQAREEIAELKTLIAFYEESRPSRLDV
ncbi:MAG: hypothetical protein A2X94_14370 [Bdellovibrionales bacterium GWB1_55_8]|nr:MAG: hypothetical protein A2X94_14370 [Bdellovibrionales bacterium GWB1_55_8]